MLVVLDAHRSFVMIDGLAPPPIAKKQEQLKTTRFSSPKS